MIRVTESVFVEVMDDRIVMTFGLSCKNRRDNVMVRSSVNGESKVSGHWTQGTFFCQVLV